MSQSYIADEIQTKPMGYGRFRMVLDGKGKPVDATIIELNPTFESQFEVEQSEAVGQSKFEFFEPFYRGKKEIWLEKYSEVAFNQIHFVEVVYFEPNDTYFEINVSSPKVGEFITLFQDVSSRQNNDRMYQDIMAHMSDSVIVTDENGKFTFISPGTHEIFGQSIDEIWRLGNIENLIGNEYQELLGKGGKKVFMERSIIDDKGEVHEISLTIDKVHIGEGRLLFVGHDVTEKNRAINEAGQQKERLSAIINTIPDLVWMKDKEGSYLACNKEFEVFFGAKETEIVGRKDHDFLSKEVAEAFREHDLEVMKRKEPIRNEERITYKNNNNEVEVEATKTPFYDVDGNIVGVLGISRDITERNRIKNELLMSKNRLEQLVETVNGVLWEADPNTFEFTFISNKVKEILGYTKEEWMSSPTFWMDNIFEEDRDHAANFCANETKQGRSHEFEYRFYKKDRSVIWVKEYVTVVRDEDGRPVNMVGLTVDVDEQLRNKQELENYHRFFDIAQDNFCIANAEGVLIELNPQFPKSLGYDYDELKGRTFLDLVHPDDVDATLREMTRLKNGRKTIHFRNRYRTKSGVYRHFDWNATPYNELYYSVARDVTNEVEATLEKEKSEFIYRNLINTAGDAIYLLNEEGIILDVNEASTEMTGYSREELVDSFMGIINKNYLDSSFFKELTKKFKRNESFLYESTHTRKDGSTVPVELNIRVVEQFDKLLYFAIVRNISDRKAQEDRFSKMVENAPYGIALVDEEGVPKLVNNELSRILGYSKDELCTKHFTDFTYEEDVNPNIDLFKDLFSGEIDQYTMKKKYVGKSGEIINANLKVAMIEDTNSPKGMMAMAMVEDLREILKSEARFESLIETAPYAIYTTTMDGDVIDSNYAASEMLGYSKEEFYGMPCSDLDLKFTKQEFMEFAKTLDDGVRFESIYLTKDQRPIPVEINAKSFQTGGEKWIVAIVSDITERKNAELELKKANAEMLNAQKIAKMGNWQLDVIKNRLTWSDEIYRIFGERPRSFQGTVGAFYDFVHPEDRDYVKNYFDECVRERKDYHITHRIVTKKGVVKYVEENATFDYDEEKNLIIARGTVQDISVAVQHQEELRLRDENLQRFFKNVHVGIARNSMDGTFIEINPEFERFTGYSVSELNKMSYWDLTPQIYEEQEKVQLESLANEGKYGPYQKHYRNKNSELVPVLLNGVKTTDSEGNHFIWSVVQDISESEEYKLKLQQDVEKFKLMLETGGLIAFEVDLETNEMTTIREKMKIDDSAFPLAEIKDFDDFFKAIKKEHRPHFKRKLNALLKKEVDRFRCDFQIKNGDKYFWHKGLLTILESDESGNPTKIFITLRNIEEEKNEEKRRIISQEKERLRISRDIHDSIGQMLVGTRLTLNVLRRNHGGLEEIDVLLYAMIKESRMIINNFGITLHDNNNLKNTFESLNEKMNKVYNGAIKLKWKGSQVINDLKVATNIFRIYQETLSNAIKYSESSEIITQINNVDYFEMIVSDSGKGFDPLNVESGFGTSNMKERALEIGGEIKIESAKGSGTKVSLKIE